MPVSRPVRVVTGCDNSMPVRVVTEGGDPVRIVTSGSSDPVRIVTEGVSTPVVVIGGGLAPDAPTFISGEVGTVDASTVVVTFSTDITAPCGDCSLGFTVLVNGLADVITACVIVGGNTVQLTLTTAIEFGDTVTISYDSTIGCIMESTSVTDLATFPAQAVTNNVIARWLSCGIPAANCLAAYEAKGAMSQAASYVNLNNPGTHDLTVGVAPSWTAGNGWTFNGVDQYLMTDLLGNAVVSMIAQFTGASVDGRRLAGSRGYIMSPYYWGTYYVHGGLQGGGASQAAGNIAIADHQGYFNGLTDLPAIGAGTEYAEAIYIGAANNGSGGIQGPFPGTIESIYFYDIDIAPYITCLVTAMSGIPAESDALGTGLVEYWPLNEANGNATGAKAGIVLVDTNSVGAAAGAVYATARTFDGDTATIQSLQAAYDAAIDFTGSFTVAAWYYQTNNPTAIPFDYHRIVHTYQANVGGYMLSTNLAGGYWMDITNGGTSKLFHGPNVPSNNAWHCVFMWHDDTGNLVGMSVDNQSAITESYSGGIASSPLGLAIGGVVGDFESDGRIGPVAMWSRVLNATERNTFYNGGVGKVYPL